MAEVKVERILSPEAWKKRQLGNLRAVGEANYSIGIKSPKKDTIAAGVAAEAKYAERVKEAIEEERRKKALQTVSLQEWATYAEEIGKGRLVEGVTKREKKVDRFVRAWHPILVDHVSKIDVMPAVTDTDMKERIIANWEGLKALKGTWR